MSKNTNNYTRQAEASRADFLKYDQESMIRRFGLKHDADLLYISFLGEEYSVNRQTGEVIRIADATLASFSAVMSIYDVLCCSKEGAKLSQKWRTLQNLSPPSLGSSQISMDILEGRRFSGKLPELKNACEKLNGRESTNADVGYIFDIFPFLPVLFQYWEGDDEIEPKIMYLFDENTLDYLHHETVWYIVVHLIALIDTAMDLAGNLKNTPNV